MIIPVTAKATKSAWLVRAAALLLVSTQAGILQAVQIPILNNSFELPDAGSNGQNYFVGVPDNWTASEGLDDVFVEFTDAVGMSGGEGLQYAGMDSNVAAGGYIYQDLGVTFKPNMTYSLNVEGAHRSGFTHSLLEFGLFSSNNIGVDLDTPGFIDLQAIDLSSANPDADGGVNVFRGAGDLALVGSGTLGERFKFETGATPPTGNLVVFVRDTAMGGRVNFDNVRLEEYPIGTDGDVDGDGDTDLVDYGFIADNFRRSGDRSMGDLTGNGFVDTNDFLLWRQIHNAPIMGNVSVDAPEPSACLLSLMGLGLLGRRGARR